jgi:hypothetical protein
MPIGPEFGTIAVSRTFRRTGEIWCRERASPRLRVMLTRKFSNSRTGVPASGWVFDLVGRRLLSRVPVQ